MDIGYGEDFVWENSVLPNLIMKVIGDGYGEVTYLAKSKGSESFRRYILDCKEFYSTHSKVAVDCKKCKDNCNKNPSDKEADVSKNTLGEASSQSGVVVAVGDFWLTNDTKDVCEVVSIYKEDGIMWVESYSENDETLDSDPIDQFVVSYTALDGGWVYEKDGDKADSQWMYTDTEDTEMSDELTDNLGIVAYVEGYKQGFAGAKYCDKQKSIAVSTFEDAYRVWSGLSEEQLGKSDSDIRGSYDNGVNDGYEKAVAEFELGNEFTDKIKISTFDEGYAQGHAAAKHREGQKSYKMNGSKEQIGKSIDIELVNHPKHYNLDKSGIECIEVARHRNFNVGSALKYLWRCGLKSGNSDIQDLEKAVWYLNDEIKSLKDKGNEKS